MEQAKAVLPGAVTYCGNAYECVEDADAAVIVTEWNIFRALDLDRVRTLMRSPVLIDLRNIYRGEQVREKGFVYADIGRGISDPVSSHAIDAA
jgi:UDPglucose 6-dehydrogenase